MKTSVVVAVAVAAAVGLAGCASPRFGTDGFNASLVRRPDPMLPNIFVVDEKIVLDQEPVRVRRTEGRVTISWALPFGSEYSFPDDRAIILSGSESYPGASPLPRDLACAIEGRAKKTFTCTYTYRGEGPARWKYSVRVNRGATELERLDPWVSQD